MFLKGTYNMNLMYSYFKIIIDSVHNLTLHNLEIHIILYRNITLPIDCAKLDLILYCN